jgi:MFS family permease
MPSPSRSPVARWLGAGSRVSRASGPSWRTAGRSLRNRNFRVFLVGQGLSNTGMWVQQTAELWVILRLTGSGAALGLHSVLRYGPVLILGVYGGLFTDRMDRRKLLILTQGLHTVATSALTIAAWAGSASLPLIYGVVLAQGLVNAVDNPLRRGFIRDLASDEELANAVSLNGTMSTVTRTIGPAIGGLLITAFGVEWCFGINAVSYVAVLASLFMIDRGALRRFQPVLRGPGQLREGFRYAWSSDWVRTTLILVGVLSTFAWNWAVLLPVYATATFGGDASLYGLLQSLLSIGSFAGALAIARVVRPEGRHLIVWGGILAASLAVTATAPVLAVGIAGLVLLGMAGTSFTIAAQARLQINVDDSMNGRIMALFTVGWVGSKPVGGLLGGWLMDAGGPRAAFGVGAAMVALVVLAAALRRSNQPASPGKELGG